MIKTVNKHPARSLCLLFLFGLLFARFSTARAAPEPQLTAEDTCIMMALNEAGNGFGLGFPPGTQFTANTGMAIHSVKMPNGTMAIDVYRGLPPYYRMEFEEYCPGSGDRDCEGTLRNDSTLSTDDHFVKVGYWKFVVIERFSSSTGTFINADARDEGQVLFQTAKKYWNIYQQNGRCDGGASEPSGPIISEPQYSDPNGDSPYIEEPQYSEPNGELPYIDEPQSADPSTSDACQHISCLNPACSEDGTQAWFNPVCVGGFCDYSSSPAQACEHGCEDGVGCLDQDFEAWCTDFRSNNCPSFCEDSWLNVAIDCNEHMECVYSPVFCENGCANGHCLSQTFSGGNNNNQDNWLTLLAIGGGITVVGGAAVGGGFLGYKALQALKLGKLKGVEAKDSDKSALRKSFEYSKKGMEYTDKVAGLLGKLKFAPEAKQEWLRARNFMHQMPSELSTQQYIEASKRRMKPMGKVGKAIGVAGKIFDVVDAAVKAEDVIKARGYTGWEKVGAYYVEGANKVFTTVLTKNPVVSAADQVLGDLTGVNVENTIRATEEGWHRATNYVSRKIYSVDKLDQVARSKTEASQYIKTLNRMRKQGRIDPAQARRLAREVYKKKLR